MKRARIICSQ